MRVSTEGHYEKLRSLFSAKKDGFIKKASEVHKDNYDYSLVDYVNNKTKVKIICKEHGVFEQRPDNHVNLKHKCPKCKASNQSARQIKSEIRILEQFNKIHGFRFDYSKVKYLNGQTEVVIICPNHGEFKQKPQNHLAGKSCQKCYDERRKKLPDELRKLHKRIACSIMNSFRNRGYTKRGKTIKILGCCWDDFKTHLENNPYNFKICDKNLDLDHIIPISKAKTEEDIYKLNHYTNFQLLPSDYNRNIKRIFDYDADDFTKYIKNIKNDTRFSKRATN